MSTDRVPTDADEESPGARLKNNTWYVRGTGDAVVVFVHGIFSDSTACWCRQGSQPTYWPALVGMDPRFGDSSIFLGGYHTQVDSADYDLMNCAAELLRALQRPGMDGSPSVLDNYKRLFFICHSTGGVVVRYMLDRWSREFQTCAVGLALIASPALGSDWAVLAQDLARVYNHRLGLQLRAGGESLEDLDARFRDLVHERRLPALVGGEAYENRFILHRWWLPLRWRIVDRASAGRGYWGAPVNLAGTDHFTAVKPDSPEHPAHLFVVDLWLRFIDENGGAAGLRQWQKPQSLPMPLDAADGPTRSSPGRMPLTVGVVGVVGVLATAAFLWFRPDPPANAVEASDRFLRAFDRKDFKTIDESLIGSRIQPGTMRAAWIAEAQFRRAQRADKVENRALVFQAGSRGTFLYGQFLMDGSFTLVRHQSTAGGVESCEDVWIEQERSGWRVISFLLGRPGWDNQCSGPTEIGAANQTAEAFLNHLDEDADEAAITMLGVNVRSLKGLAGLLVSMKESSKNRTGQRRVFVTFPRPEVSVTPDTQRAGDFIFVRFASPATGGTIFEDVFVERERDSKWTIAAFGPAFGPPGIQIPSSSVVTGDSGLVRWARIPAGTFKMGCSFRDSECDGDEKPQHVVTISRPYELMTTEVTVEMFRVYGRETSRPVPQQESFTVNQRQPLVNVDWDEAVGFCDWAGGRLPTEAEWERAARGGRDDLKYPWGNTYPADVPGAENGARFSSSEPRAVGRYAANPFGLFDMAGNVREWVSDWHGAYPTASVKDPRGPATGDHRVMRGGSWLDHWRFQRVSFRSGAQSSYRNQDFGFRCARDVSP